jgi:hypothetical protein
MILLQEDEANYLDYLGTLYLSNKNISRPLQSLETILLKKEAILPFILLFYNIPLSRKC